MIVHRRTARVLPVNAAGQVLLLHGHDPARPDEPYWFTVGGGADDGETLAAAAVRELFEETGIVIAEDQLVGPIHRGEHAYSFNGVDHLSDSTFFAVVVEDCAVSFDGLDAEERDHVLEARWWDPSELTSDVRLSNAEVPSIARSAVRQAGGVRVHRWPDAEGAAALLQRAEDLLQRPGRTVLGIAGPPAGGKSTLTDWLVRELSTRHPSRIGHVGMDAFHLGHRVLEVHDLVGVKGAPQTFDALGYAALLQRIRESADPVYAPVFHREIEDSIAHESEIGAEAALVITEGNYLLLDTSPWNAVRPLLDEAWYVHLDDDERRRRLVKRHLRFGRTQAEAEERTNGSDEDNAVLIAATAVRADLRVELS